MMNRKVAVFLACVWGGFFISGYSAWKAATLIDGYHNDPSLFGAKPSGTRYVPQEIELLIGAFPLDQRLLNAYMVNLYTHGRDTSGEKSLLIEQLVREAGFRYTPAQQNLLILDAERGEFTDLMRRADALLRRNKLRNEVFAMFRAGQPDLRFRKALALSIAADPEWRGAYFGSIGRTVSDYEGQSWVQLANDLAVKNSPIVRSEASPVLFSLTGDKNYFTAYALWNALSPRLRSRNFRDTLFRTFSSRRGMVVYDALPFEWIFDESSDVSSEFVTGPASLGLTPRNTESNTSPFATIIKANQKRNSMVLTLVQSEPQAYRDLEISVQCLQPSGSKNEIALTPASNVRSTQVQITASLAQYTNCEFSLIELFLRSNSSSSSKFTVTDIVFN